MLRPTPAETVAGIQRMIVETFQPELTSPYAQHQATTALGVLGFLSASLDAIGRYDEQEVADLQATTGALRALAERGLIAAGALRSTLVAASPADRRALEAVMAEFAATLALGHLSDPAAPEVRGYLRRHLDRMRTLLGPAAGARG